MILYLAPARADLVPRLGFIWPKRLPKSSHIYIFIYFFLKPRQVHPRLKSMSSSAADGEPIYTLKVADFTSIRFFIFVALCFFGVSRYVLKAIKYRVRIKSATRTYLC